MHFLIYERTAIWLFVPSASETSLVEARFTAEVAKVIAKL